MKSSSRIFRARGCRSSAVARGLDPLDENLGTALQISDVARRLFSLGVKQHERRKSLNPEFLGELFVLLFQFVALCFPTGKIEFNEDQTFLRRTS